MSDRYIQLGERSGSRVVISKIAGTEKRAMYLVRCDCGREDTVRGNAFRLYNQCQDCAGGPTSTLGPAKGKRHKESRTRLYGLWASMVHRCSSRISKKDRNHWNYYARGIRVCEEWKDWPTFRAWATSNGYQYGLTLERKDSDLGYNPHNCEWVTRSENARRRHQFWRHGLHIPIEMFWGRT